MLTAPKTSIEPTLRSIANCIRIETEEWRIADERYRDLGNWLLHNESSPLTDYNVEVFPQGSMALGTTTTPISTNGAYDIDLVCRLDNLPPNTSQSQLYYLLKGALEIYVSDLNQCSGVNETRRGLELTYEDGSMFHLDALPARPWNFSSVDRSDLLAHVSQGIANTALAITDKKALDFCSPRGKWLMSNPQGLKLWFEQRMGRSLHLAESQRLEKYAKSGNVEAVPKSPVATPLRDAVVLLKRFRACLFPKPRDGSDDHAPISVVLTVLAARLYEDGDDVFSILWKVATRHQEWMTGGQRGNGICNPVNPKEEYTDKWHKHPEKRQRFEEYMSHLKHDLARLRDSGSNRELLQVLVECFDGAAIERCLRRNSGLLNDLDNGFVDQVYSVWDQPHAKQALTRDCKRFHLKAFERPVLGWNKVESGIEVTKGNELRFECTFPLTNRDVVRWQVVNTGREAKNENGLRGDIFKDNKQHDQRARVEPTGYDGIHAIRCLVYRNGKLFAVSYWFRIDVRDDIQ